MCGCSEGRPLGDFWLVVHLTFGQPRMGEDEHQHRRSWSEHRDINEVMLATALVPRGFLSL